MRRTDPTPSQRLSPYTLKDLMVPCQFREGVTADELRQILERERRDDPRVGLCSEITGAAEAIETEANGRCIICGERRQLVDDRQTMCDECQRRETIRHGRAVSEAATRKRAAREAERRLAALQERIARDES